MQRDLAKAICEETLSCCRELNRSLGILQKYVDPDFFGRRRRDVGEIMGNLYFDVLCEVFRQYPDLEPDWVE